MHGGFSDNDCFPEAALMGEQTRDSKLVCLTVSRYTNRGGNCVIFIFTSSINWGQHLKDRICSSGSKFFSLRVHPILEGFVVQ